MQPDKQAFFPIGRADNPRWLAPAGYRLQGDPFLGWRPYRVTSRLAWVAMKSAMRWGATPTPLPADNSYVDRIANLDWRSLGWCRSSDPEPLIYLGTAGPKRKAVVHLIDPISHACELIVKVPMTEAAEWAVTHEAQTLLDLQHEGFTAAPRLVAFDRAAGIASQTPVHGSRSGLKCTREVAVLLQSLERPGECLSLREMSSQLKAKGARLDLAAEYAALVARAIEKMDDTTELPAMRIHGDFAPWNIKLLNGSAVLVDWEDSQARGLPLHDAYHFVHMARCLFGKRPRPVWPELRFRYAFSLTDAQCRKLELAYLVQMLAGEFAPPSQTYTAFLLATLRKAMTEP